MIFDISLPWFGIVVAPATNHSRCNWAFLRHIESVYLKYATFKGIVNIDKLPLAVDMKGFRSQVASESNTNRDNKKRLKQNYTYKYILRW